MRAYEEAAKIIASAHILHRWVLTEVARNNPTGARDLYHRIVERNPQDVFAWWMLPSTCSRRDDWDEAHRATRRVLTLDPSRADARSAIEDMERKRPGHIRSSSSQPGVK